MKRIVCLSAVVVVAAACSGSSSTADAGNDAGEMEFTFDVSGTAAIYPEALGLLMDAGEPTTVAGLTLRVEEPLKVALKDPLGQFSSAVLDSSGAFSATGISADLVNLGVAAGVVDDAGTRAVRSATVLWDVALEGKKPDKNLTNTKAWVLPKRLHDVLTAAVGESTLLSFTGSNQKRTLVSAGCIIGRVVNAQGAPVSGVKVVPTTSALASRFVYPTTDLTGTGLSTSLNGLFIFVHDGSDNVAQFNFDVMGMSAYKRRSAGAAKDACLIATVYPGDTPP